MARYLALVYGALNYLGFLAVFLYLIGFVGNFVVPRSVDHGPPAPVGLAIVIDVALVALFGVQHSVMARPGFKRWLTRVLPESIERSTYVLASNLVLALLFWQWRPIPTTIWNLTMPAERTVLWGLFWIGWAVALASTFMISHVDLVGLRQVYLAWQGRAYSHVGFHARALYRVVRHPLMLGFVFAFWATPTMTAGHLLFAVAATGYILIAVQFEERDLIAALGDEYLRYRRQVPMIVPVRRRGALRRTVAGRIGPRPGMRT
ncbi:methanethiol S-methyltransferase [[Mycobacterium] crassicus]|uniref:methanethiol S-methyltransferase n=1 Tax=[Mycobacterium] crassicus TaxID=2872309 RepID=A0ABU5XEQ9_9MYCO|nr:methanethiol S-methyltransferase [Mycolicibacter sp. MYC098]MEB3020796.1 NnrU family protein [Mycolicibacter sp. MYC098]